MPIINLLPNKANGFDYNENGKLVLSLNSNNTLVADANGLSVKLKPNGGLVTTDDGISVSTNAPITSINWVPSQSEYVGTRMINGIQFSHYKYNISAIADANKMLSFTLNKPVDTPYVIYELFLTNESANVNGAEITLFIDDSNSNFTDITTYLVIISSSSPMLAAGTPTLPTSPILLPESNVYYVGAYPHYSMIGLKYIYGKGWVATGNCGYPTHTIPSSVGV